MSFYLVDDIEQGSKKWHAWRRGVIGASEAQIIMGENRWKGRQQLIDEKLGLVEPFSGNAATQRGHDLEPHARTALERKFKVKLQPTIVQDVHEPFLAASLDAINKEKNRIFEIKCGVKAYEIVASTRKVPTYNVAQVQHMLMVTQLEQMTFAVFSPGDPLITLEVYRNETYIRELRRREKDFIRELEQKGHSIQKKFRGVRIESKNFLADGKNELSVSIPASEWIVENRLLKFWDGKNYLEGDEPGLYELNGLDHYWDGEQWVRPKKVGDYILNGSEAHWNGESWDS